VPTVAPVAPVAPTPAPTVTPKPAVVVAGKAAIRSTKLKVASKQVAVSVRCTGGTACTGTLRLRTASKLRLPGKGAKRIVSVSAVTKYSVRPGTTATVRLSLSRDGRSLLAAHRSVRVNVEVKPAGGASSSKRALTLRR
jgi:hypothetical protein